MKQNYTAARRVIEVIDDELTGRRMRALREKAGLSLRHVAKRWGVSAAYVSDLELGRRGWSDKKVVEFVAICHGIPKPSVTIRDA